MEHDRKEEDSNEFSHQDYEEKYLQDDKEEENIFAIERPLSERKPKLQGYEFFRKALKSPKKVVAPMVDQSELAYRILCRKYGADLCYTPMLHSKIFTKDASYRAKYFTTCPEDRPLIAQFCANDPATLLKAAKYVEDHCDAVDINLGCPQRIARRGYYGAFLMENPQLIESMVRILHENLNVPVTCKIRIFPEFEQTLAYAKMLERAGCQLLTIHGRTREMKGVNTGLANWDIVRRLKEHLSIPVISNGNIQHIDDVEACIKATGVDAVMSADAVLRDPAFYSGKKLDPFQLSFEYLELCEVYTTPVLWIKEHLCKLLVEYVTRQEEWRNRMFEQKTLKGLKEILKEFEQRVKDPSWTAPVRNCTIPKNYLPMEELEEVIGETMTMFG